MQLIPSTIIRKGTEEEIHSHRKICCAGQQCGLMLKEANNETLQELLNQALFTFPSCFLLL